LLSLGYKYARGLGVAQDKAEAIRLYREAADLCDAPAINNLGSMYEGGDGVAQDKAEAVRLYRKTADLGNVTAMANLGNMYVRGEGVPANKTEAFNLFQKAASLGNTRAMHNLANMYDRGDSVEKNRRKAAELIVLAIKNQNDFTLKQAPFGTWSAPFRKELQQLLKSEGVYAGPIDGEANDGLKNAVQALAAKNKA
jgi:TPR repeat protein